MAKIVHKDIGSLATPEATFTVGGTNTDPTNLIVKQQDADGLETTILNNVLVSTLSGVTTPVAKTATGKFKLNPGVQLTKEGYWLFRFEGTGAAAAAEETEYIVDPSEFYNNAGLSTRALVTLPETKNYLRQHNVDTEDDMEIVRLINDFSDAMHFEAQREFKASGTNPQTRSFPVEQLGATQPVYIDGVYFGDSGPRSNRVWVGDLTSFTQVQIIDSTDWTTVLETVALSKITSHPTVRMSWEPIRELEFLSTVTKLRVGMRVAVLGSWGFPSVPGNVRRAVLNAVAAAFDIDVEHYRQDFGASSEVAGERGNVIMVQGGSQRLLSLPPASLAVAWSYRDSWLA